MTPAIKMSTATMAISIPKSSTVIPLQMKCEMKTNARDMAWIE